MMVATELRVLPESEWRARAAIHRERVDTLVGPYLRRRAAGAPHPVIDFLFTYYGHKPAQLRRWHPGHGIALADAAEYDGMRGYHRIPLSEVEKESGTRSAEEPDPTRIDAIEATRPGGTVVTTDPTFLLKRRNTIEFVAQLLRATAARPTRLSCFGLHEWAMVYRTDAVRHRTVPLRLGADGTNAVVESMSLRCTHFDAYRFFTPEAVGRNAHPLSRETQIDTEQPGCLHANMDLYKWAFKMTPLISSDLVLDCFESAMHARELDMRASPYDLTDYGYEPICIETPAGRAEYVRQQSEIAERSRILRARLLTMCETLLAQA